MTITDKDSVYLGHLTNQSRQKLTDALARLAECRKLNLDITDGAWTGAVDGALSATLAGRACGITRADQA